MKQVFITGKKQTELRDVPTPKAKCDWVLVKIHVAPMCTEYKQYKTGLVNHPLGHEAAGEVVEVAQPGKVKVGDRVVVMPQYPCGSCSLCVSGEYIHCEHNYNFEEFVGSDIGNATYAQYILKPSWLLPVIPDDISYEHAGMLCCGLGPTFGAMERMNVNAFDTVLITGMGPVGLGGVINAVYRGATVLAVTKNMYRSKLALELGASCILNPEDPGIDGQISDVTRGKGVTAAIECAGSPAAQRLLLDTIISNGRIAFVGESDDLNIRVSEDLIRKGLTLYGIWHYNLSVVAKLWKTVRASGEKLDQLITHMFPLRDVKKAWELQCSRQCGKVILKPFQ